MFNNVTLTKYILRINVLLYNIRIVNYSNSTLEIYMPWFHTLKTRLTFNGLEDDSFNNTEDYTSNIYYPSSTCDIYIYYSEKHSNLNILVVITINYMIE